MDIMLTFDEEFTLESAKRMLEEKYIEAVKSEDINKPISYALYETYKYFDNEVK